MIAPARRAAFTALMAIGRGRVDLDHALEQARRALSDPRDASLLRQLVTGTLRWQSRLDWTIAPLLRVPIAALDTEVLVTLRLAVFQLVELDRLPASAVVDDAVALARAAGKASATGLVNAVLRRVARGDVAPLPVASPGASLAETAAALAVSSAHPEWLVARWLAREPRDVVERWLGFNNTVAPTALRANPLAGATRESVAADLLAAGVVTRPSTVTPLGLVVEEGIVVTHPVVGEGRATVQDEGSQLAALVAPITSGHRVLDVCAAPGGKTLAYRAATGAEGRVVAGDVRAHRLEVLRATLARGHAEDVEVVELDQDAPLPFAPIFDVVAVDAPCSGLGTLRRDPDIKWRRTPDDLLAFQARQRALLVRAAAVVAPGGHLVYTTCSTEPEENIDVVRTLLDTDPAFTLVPAGAGVAALEPFVGADACFRTHPGRHGLEGYFGAVLGQRRR